MKLKPCPICGAKAFVSHSNVDGFDFGWSVGCPRFGKTLQYANLVKGVATDG